MFADHVEIEIKAGKGGDGKLSFLREKYRARGGADGGDGGRGGSIIARVDHNINTLSYYRTHRLVEADPGLIGGGKNSAGKAGDDIFINVPIGTSIFFVDESGERTLAVDLTEDGQQAILAKGGRGGFGNAHFQSSVRQSPRLAELGEPGEDHSVVMELKLVADIGLVGLPNAGKSTLLSVISNAKPEIGDYPFTTLIPNLGVVDIDKDTMLVADIPGLIEGASEGKGLGDEFLRHIERTAIIFHLVEAGNEDITLAYKTIQNELASYEVDLTTKPQLVVLTKSESVTDDVLAEKKQALEQASGQDVLVISAQAHRGLDQLLRAALPQVHAAREAAETERLNAVPVIDASDLEIPWAVAAGEEPGHWVVTGTKIEGFARRTNFDQGDAIIRLRDIIKRTGIGKALEKAGAKPGDRVHIAGNDLKWL